MLKISGLLAVIVRRQALEDQVKILRDFCMRNFLKLNIQKCEVITCDRQVGREH